MVRIGERGPEIFPLVLGGNVFGWTADRDASFEILDAFVAGGGTMIDTAEGYSSWVPGNDGFDSERIIGEWIAARRPSGVQFATKTGGHRERRDLDPLRVLRAVDESLERLNLDTIDLYWAHYDDESVPVERQVETFAEIVQLGKARTIGLSNYSPARLREWLEVATRLGVGLPVAFQPHYNLVHRAETEAEVVPIAREHGIGLLPYYALASGFLAGKYRSAGGGPKGPRAARAADYATPQGLAIVDALERIGQAHDAAIASTALAWLRVQPAVAAPIASASRAEQVPDLLASATLELTPDELAELDRVSAPAAA
ncbi:MAG: alcohol dehydrogenase [Micrococcales bacterium 73-13]|nr:MAG: alcohol dehydrogenase [Micrococcales bacterium 73-13]